jgi:hypothetical protein
MVDSGRCTQSKNFGYRSRQLKTGVGMSIIRSISCKKG